VRTRNGSGKIIEVSLILYKTSQACERKQRGPILQADLELLSSGRKS